MNGKESFLAWLRPKECQVEVEVLWKRKLSGADDKFAKLSRPKRIEEEREGGRENLESTQNYEIQQSASLNQDSFPLDKGKQGKVCSSGLKLATFFICHIF
jgi:hypothetical protein